MLPNFILTVEEKELMHMLVVRFLCRNQIDEKFALLLATSMIETAKEQNVEVKLIHEYIPESSMYGNMAYSKVSFAVLYKDDTAKEKFLKILKRE